MGALTGGLGRGMCNPEAPSSSPALTTNLICSLDSSESNPRVNSQMVCLKPVGILKLVMFHVKIFGSVIFSTYFLLTFVLPTEKKGTESVLRC